MLTRLKGVTYLGSHSRITGQVRDLNVVFMVPGIWIGREKRSQSGEFMPWATIRSLEADSRDEIERRVTATRALAFGVLSLAFPKKSTNSFLVVRDDEGDWIFSVPGLSAIELHSGLQPMARKYVETATRTEPPVPTDTEAPTLDPAERLRRLDGLLAEGLISDVEHRERRAAILSDL